MHLKSKLMNLSQTELNWLPWFGKTGKFAMWWSCYLNRSHYSAVEKTFDGIATTRTRILMHWTNTQWEHLANLADFLSRDFANPNSAALLDKKAHMPDISEIFIIDHTGQVMASTFANSIGKRDLLPAAVNAGLQQPFLHGPYKDAATLAIKASSSKFHDEVTLMFYQPIHKEGKSIGCVCARVPNDVIGDLIQREAGHIFQESGDNYLFMVKPQFDPSIQPGTALSRSRFEDQSFTLGDNLKQGIPTKWGTVQVERHTELELRFSDPATGQLHPGVRETIAKGKNLFVTYPGYSDYRHIPVIGKGVTFQLPGSPDLWGMMCEADLEEVYRKRSLNFQLMRLFIGIILGLWTVNLSLGAISGISFIQTQIITACLTALTAVAFYKLGSNRIATRIDEMSEVIRTIAEGEGNLKQRLELERLNIDETGNLAKWINSFIDNLDGIVGHVIVATDDVRHTNDSMLGKNRDAMNISKEVLDAIQGMLKSMEMQIQEINSAENTADSMRTAMQQVVENTRLQFQLVQSKTDEIRKTIESSSHTIQNLNNRAAEIGKVVNVINDIASQTNLLALNAAIEAARAGEEGRGFAVVADEVRKLAERTSKATKDIRLMIESVQTEAKGAVSIMEDGMQGVEEGLRLAQETASDNKDMHDIVAKLFQTIHAVSESSYEQSNSAKMLSSVTSKMKHSVETLSRSGDQVRITASKLHKLTGQFQVSSRL
jgi:methyl-accepting chemotaxis protein